LRIATNNFSKPYDFILPGRFSLFLRLTLNAFRCRTSIHFVVTVISNKFYHFAEMLGLI